MISFGFLAINTQVYPQLAKVSETALPIPLPAPVIITSFFLKVIPSENYVEPSAMQAIQKY